MEKEEYKQLENLLGKLQIELGNRFAIIPDHLNGGCHIAIFNSTGIMEKQEQSFDIESTVKKLNYGI